MSIQNKVFFHDVASIDYKDCWDLQEQLLQKAVDCKMRNRELPAEQQILPEHHLIFCEHPHVYTLGKSGSLDHLLLSETELYDKGVEFFKINRGGDITYHGPGQITGYPIFDLDFFFTDVHKYVRYLEEVVIRTLAEYGLEGMRIAGYTGVWLEGDGEKPKPSAPITQPL